MPIYEYRCSRCGKKSSRVWLKAPSPVEEVSLRCRACGGGELERVLSRFSNPKSAERRLESLADGSSLAGLDEKDPRSMARLMRKMSEETGESLEGEDAEMLERMEAGEMPDDPAGEARGGDEEFI